MIKRRISKNILEIAINTNKEHKKRLDLQKPITYHWYKVLPSNKGKIVWTYSRAADPDPYLSTKTVLYKRSDDEIGIEGALGQIKVRDFLFFPELSKRQDVIIDDSIYVFNSFSVKKAEDKYHKVLIKIIDAKDFSIVEQDVEAA